MEGNWLRTDEIHRNISTNKLENITWKLIDKEEFPISMLDENEDEFERADTYKYEGKEQTLYLQDLHKDEYIWAKQLLVIDKKSNLKTFETIFYAAEESEFQPMEAHYTGQLFKNQTEVIFGINYHSFGCPSITFIDSKKEPILINCDNRH